MKERRNEKEKWNHLLQPIAMKKEYLAVYSVHLVSLFKCHET